MTENRSTRKAWLIYSLLRLAFFFVPLVVLYLLGLGPWWSVGFAALIGVSLSMLLLSKPREQAAESVYEWRHRDREHDDIVEDAEIESVETETVETEGVEPSESGDDKPGLSQ